MSRQDLYNRLNDVPFKPFRLRLTTNSTVNIPSWGAIFVGESSAIVPIEMTNDPDGFPIIKRWKTVALAHIVEMSDIESKENRSPKRRK